MDKNETVTIPKWLYDELQKDADLIRHLTHYRGSGWIKEVKREMESDKQYHLGAFETIEDRKERRKYEKERTNYMTCRRCI